MKLAESQSVADSTARWLFLGFTAAFAVKVPLFPVHTWLPDAHTEAPTAGSVILAGVLLKLGTYGMLRFGLYLFPKAAVDLAPILLTLAAIGIIYGAVVAAMQRDLKRLVAYSSVAHMGFIVLGIFAFSSQGLSGGVLQMVNHGLSTGALFLLVGMIYERRHTRIISELGGLQKPAPILAAVFTLVMLSSIGLPALNGFVGEFLILIGTFVTHRWWAVVDRVGCDPRRRLPALGLPAGVPRRAGGRERHHPRHDVARARRHPAPARAHRVPRRLPEARPRPHPTVGRPADRPRRAAQRLRGARRGASALDRGQVTTLLAQAQGGLPPLRLPEVAYSDIGPMIILVVGALGLLTVASLVKAKPARGFYALFTVGTAGSALVSAAWLWLGLDEAGSGPRFAFANMISIDGFAVFFFVVIAISVVLAALLGDAYLRREQLDGPEFYVLVLLSAAGGMLMAAANDLIVIFLGLETLSIALFVLAGFHRRRAESGEAAMKYFVLSAFSSAFLLYGIALTYGSTGTTNLAGIAQWLGTNVALTNGVLMAGMAFLLVGFGFKVAAVPFHTWTPDVYQGSPTPVSAFMAGASKAAGFAALLRVFFSTFSVLRPDWKPLIWALAVASLLVGSTLAIVQSDVKRMLAYSSISHAGYILVGLQAANDRGVAGSLFYLLAYTFMVMGSFTIATVVGRRGDAAHDLDNYKGLARRRPAVALGFTVLLMAQAGVPFTSGFLAKFYVISAAVESRSYALALIAMVAAVIAAFFYLRVVITMYSAADADEATEPARLPLPFGAGLVLASAVAFTLIAGILPQTFFDFARNATLLF